MSKRIFTLFSLVLFFHNIFAIDVAITFMNGSKMEGKLEKVEVEKYDGTQKREVTAITVAQGNAEYPIPFDKMKSITFLHKGDSVSCFEDSSFQPIRSFCTQKMVYKIDAPVTAKAKGNAEIIDDFKFTFHISKGDKKEKAEGFLYKITIKDKGAEGNVSQEKLEVTLKETEKNSIKSIIFK